MNRPTSSGIFLIAMMAVFFEGVSAEPSLRTSVPKPPPFTATLTNNAPLAIGMDVEETSRVLGTSLNYISGRPGDEVYLAYRPGGGSELMSQKDRLYLQFRKGRLAGWKGDWGRHWMWPAQ